MHLALSDSPVFGPKWQEGQGPNPEWLLFCAQVFSLWLGQAAGVLSTRWGKEESG